jgi:hypothetical protein
METSKTKEKKALSKKTMHVKIDGVWTVYDFITLFKSINTLHRYYRTIDGVIASIKEYEKTNIVFNPKYNSSKEFREQIFCFNDYYYDSIRPSYLNDMEHIRSASFVETSTGMKTTLTRLINLKNEIQIRKVKYASPGFIDFVGIGKTVEQLKEIIFHYFPNKKDKIEIEILRQKRNKILIQNMKDIGFDKLMLQRLFLDEELNISGLGKLVEDKKIVDIEILDNE